MYLTKVKNKEISFCFLLKNTDNWLWMLFISLEELYSSFLLQSQRFFVFLSKSLSSILWMSKKWHKIYVNGAKSSGVLLEKEGILWLKFCWKVSSSGGGRKKKVSGSIRSQVTYKVKSFFFRVEEAFCEKVACKFKVSNEFKIVWEKQRSLLLFRLKFLELWNYFESLKNFSVISFQEV